MKATPPPESALNGNGNINSKFWRRGTTVIALVALVAIASYLLLRFVFCVNPKIYDAPLLFTLLIGGTPLVFRLIKRALNREFGSDLLGGISTVTAVIMGEYLAGAIIVLMLAGGEALEDYALRRASSVLAALAKRMPSVAHRKTGQITEDVALHDVAISDIIEIYPHDICPVDGVVIAGRGMMDESYLTGEPFKIRKTAGSTVISGAINGESALTIRATRVAADSRYAKIMIVMRESEQTRPRLRRLGDQLGAIYTPIALAVALLAWFLTGEAIRFLAVLVIATPCPLLLGIPIAIIGSISLCARRAIIVKDPVALEQIGECKTAIFDKTGTLTYGEPKLTEQFTDPGFAQQEVLALAASLELYSKHPLARAILAKAKEEGLGLQQATKVSEPPGSGLCGIIANNRVQITSRANLVSQDSSIQEQFPPATGGLECVVVIGGQFAAAFRFRDSPRAEGYSFIQHLGPKHQFQRVTIVSGDRESEVRYLSEQVGVTDIQAQKSPEEKLVIVREETKRAKTLYVGDGINDAPAMMSATVGMALGQNSEVTAEAADVVVMDNSLKKVDEFMHISRRMRNIALQSAVGGMVLSLGGMLLAANGHLSPVAGAISQEIIDVLAILNALRAALLPRVLSDI